MFHFSKCPLFFLGWLNSRLMSNTIETNQVLSHIKHAHKLSLSLSSTSSLLTLYIIYSIFTHLYIIPVEYHEGKKSEYVFTFSKALDHMLYLIHKDLQEFSKCTQRPCFECQFHITLREGVINAQGVRYSLKYLHSFWECPTPCVRHPRVSFHIDKTIFKKKKNEFLF